MITGKKHTEEAKMKMSIARKGRKPMLGHKHTDETKRKMSLSHQGKKLSEETKKRLSIQRIGINNPNWKGDNIKRKGNMGLHIWVKRRKLKPKFCECCKTNPPYDLANISNEYKRDLDDWEWLCRSCHMHKDNRIKNLKQYRDKG